MSAVLLLYQLLIGCGSFDFALSLQTSRSGEMPETSHLWSRVVRSPLLINLKVHTFWAMAISINILAG